MSSINESKEKLENEYTKQLQDKFNESKEKLENEYKKKIDELKNKYDLLVEEFEKRLS
ncbi:MAG: hypothetical protein ACP5L0_01225 [Caldisphaera sp.]|jgi:transketolase|uniref:hypothetical protein n=1 Tax=Caldisphaera sp. TaxID=2060322 RepID=UPI00268043EE